MITIHQGTENKEKKYFFFQSGSVKAHLQYNFAVSLSYKF